MFRKTLACTALIIFVFHQLSAQKTTDSVYQCPATVVIFRTFDFFNFKFSYRLSANDSLLGRIRTHDVFVLQIFKPSVSLYAAIKAPSLNASKKSRYMRIKKIEYKIALKPGGVYFVKSGFLKEQLFNYPRQPTITHIKGNAIRKYLRKGFIKRKLKHHLYHEWLTDHDLLKYA